jgi:hypothetical protein
MWFETLVGFREENPQQVRDNLDVVGEQMTSKVNGRQLVCGRLETPSLAELRARVQVNQTRGQLKLSEIVADVQKLHQEQANAGALFQVASQFNLLEMISPDVTPESGVSRYENDRTQGPACAIACGAGTIFRNYFAEVNGNVGQNSANQIDCIRDLGVALGNVDERLWVMRNGYALATATGLQEITQQLSSADESQRDLLRQTLRIGVHWDTQVTLANAEHQVTQAYCSALPVAYSSLSQELWSDFAQLVLEAAYEATICAAILNSAATANHQVFLTLLGGGAFGNHDDWIFSAIERALRLYAESDLDVAIVSYGSSKPRVQQLVNAF